MKSTAKQSLHSGTLDIGRIKSGRNSSLLQRPYRRHLAPVQGSRKANTPALANFSLEAKGPDGKSKVLFRQAFYNGCMGARAMHQMRSYRKYISPMYDGNAYTITSTYHEEILRLYCVWPTEQIDLERSGNTSYRMSELGRFFLTDPNEPDALDWGVAAWRNLRDWARKQRDELNAITKRGLADNSSASSNRRRSGSTENLILSDTKPEIEDVSDVEDTPRQHRELPKSSQDQRDSSESDLGELDESVEDQVAWSPTNNVSEGLRASNKHRISPTKSDTDNDHLALSPAVQSRPTKMMKPSNIALNRNIPPTTAADRSSSPDVLGLSADNTPTKPRKRVFVAPSRRQE